MEPIRLKTAESCLKHYDPTKESKTGMFYVPEDQYHSGPGLSRSNIHTLAEKSPKHFQAEKAKPRDPTDAMIFGTRFHKILLEHDMFFEKYMKAPDFSEMFGDMRSSTNRKKRDSWLADNAAGKELVKPEDWDRLVAMMESCANSGTVQNLLKDGISEPSIYWYQDEILCKCRPDYLRDDGIIVDIKTTSDASLEGFKKSVGNYRYDLQEAFYSLGVEAETKNKNVQFVIIAVESQPPFAVAEYVLDPIWKECAIVDINIGLERFRESLKSSTYEGYPQKIQNLTPPKWFVAKYR